MLLAPVDRSTQQWALHHPLPLRSPGPSRPSVLALPRSPISSSPAALSAERSAALVPSLTARRTSSTPSVAEVSFRILRAHDPGAILIDVYLVARICFAIQVRCDSIKNRSDVVYTMCITSLLSVKPCFYAGSNHRRHYITNFICTSKRVRTLQRRPIRTRIGLRIVAERELF